MTVYGSQYVEGKIQDVRYSDTSAHLFWIPRLGGMDIKPTSAYYMIYNAADTAQSSTSSAMTLCTVETEAWLGFKTLTARWNLCATISNASLGFSASIRDVQYSSATAGRVYLTNIYKTTASACSLVDNGDTPGGATVDGSPYSPVMYGSVNLASTTTYTIGENYRMRVRYTYGSQTYYDQVYFDVVYSPMCPIVTSRMIDDKHPDWQSMRPAEWVSWKPAIHAGHAELCRRVRSMGRRASFIAKREELLPYEMAFIEAEIARSFLAFPTEQRAQIIDATEDLWNSKGEFDYAEARDDGEIDVSPVVFSSSMTR